MDTLSKASSSETNQSDVFVPETIEQETYLLLLIADTLHEYVIDRAPEHHKVNNVLFVFYSFNS